jgi:CheY-like chemotaxis protein
MTNVVLIEDDKNLIQLYRTELELLGANVEIATDGKQGLALVKEKKPDLILMDVILPEKIGLSILKELKSQEDTKNIPVVIMSNYDQGENPRKAIEMGAASFLSKQQFTPQELVKEALSVLES